MQTHTPVQVGGREAPACCVLCAWRVDSQAGWAVRGALAEGWAQGGRCGRVPWPACPPTRYVQPPMISFEAIFEQSTPNSPIVFILSPGSDPASDLMKLAERTGFGGNRLKFLAMGQGQDKVICCWKEQL